MSIPEGAPEYPACPDPADTHDARFRLGLFPYLLRFGSNLGGVMTPEHTHTEPTPCTFTEVSALGRNIGLHDSSVPSACTATHLQNFDALSREAMLRHLSRGTLLRGFCSNRRQGIVPSPCRGRKVLSI